MQNHSPNKPKKKTLLKSTKFDAKHLIACVAGVRRGGRGGETSEPARRKNERAKCASIGQGDVCKDATVFFILPNKHSKL